MFKFPNVCCIKNNNNTNKYSNYKKYEYEYVINICEHISIIRIFSEQGRKKAKCVGKNIPSTAIFTFPCPLGSNISQPVKYRKQTPQFDCEMSW